VNILGIETSSAVCSVGLVNEQGWSVERNIIDPHIHSEKLLTLVEELLQTAGFKPGNLDAVAVSIGPGSFTGLRIGLSSAKGMCYALNKKLIPVSTFDAMVWAVQESGTAFTTINIAIDAKQGEFYCGSINRIDHQDLAMMNVRTRRLEELPWPTLLSNSSLWITDRPEVIRTYGVPPELVLDHAQFCRGDVVARFGIGKYAKNEFADLASIVPLYLKEFVVRTAIR
jgi:tRNA threonylcarbamoyladenosine biosynthesis protein TsaB